MKTLMSEDPEKAAKEKCQWLCENTFGVYTTRENKNHSWSIMNGGTEHERFLPLTVNRLKTTREDEQALGLVGEPE